MRRLHGRAFACLKGLQRVVIACRLHTDYRCFRRQRLHCRGDARQQSAAAAGRDNRIHRHAQRPGLLHHFQPDRSLSGHDVWIIERRHYHGPALGGDGGRDRLAALGHPVIKADFGPVSPRRLGLHLGRVTGHDDQGRHAQQLRRQRHTLGVIAGRERHDPPDPFLGAQLNQPVVGPAKLERPHPLQGLGLDQHPQPQPVIQRRALDHRRLHRMPVQSPGRRLDIGKGNRHVANTWASSANALNSSALPDGSRKNIVACSPGSPLNRT